MNKDIYFFDTYAIIEVLKGNDGYEKYKECRGIISVFNLVELHLHVTRIFGEKIADKVLEEYSSSVINFELEDIKETTKLKIRYANKKLSIPDSIGYVISKRLGIKFLTGDKNFKGFENVEFVV
ncbi:MAG: PIN domain-containing protein [Nanoarchaeota archaeon]